MDGGGHVAAPIASGSPTWVAWNLPSSPAAPADHLWQRCVLSTMDSTNRSPAPLRPVHQRHVVEQTLALLPGPLRHAMEPVAESARRALRVGGHATRGLGPWWGPSVTANITTTQPWMQAALGNSPAVVQADELRSLGLLATRLLSTQPVPAPRAEDESQRGRCSPEDLPGPCARPGPSTRSIRPSARPEPVLFAIVVSPPAASRPRPARGVSRGSA